MTPGYAWSIRRPLRGHVIFTFVAASHIPQKSSILVLIYRGRVVKYLLSSPVTLESTAICRYDFGLSTTGSDAMMGFETLAVVLFVGWVLATSLFLRFG